MPKIILNSTGDQFFLPDSSQFYFKDLPETKWLRYLPNSDHKQSLDVAKSLASWIDQINDGETPPRYNWTIETDGAIRVETVDRRQTEYASGRRQIPTREIFGWKPSVQSGPPTIWHPSNRESTGVMFRRRHKAGRLLWWSSLTRSRACWNPI